MSNPLAPAESLLTRPPLATSGVAATITPQEFGVILDLAANANGPVGRILQLGPLFTRAVALANQPDPIGPIAVGTALTSTASE